VSDGTYLAIVAGIQVVIVLVANGVFSAFKDRRDASIKAQEKAEDYKRQDLVADRVAAAADKLLEAQSATIQRTEEVARLAALADERTNAQLVASAEQLQKIHTLVNSDMTAARTAERDSLKLLVIALRKNDKLLDSERKEIANAEKRIDELNQILADRLAAQQIVDAQSKHDEQHDEQIDMK
jgi:hypothetical protein